MMLKSVPLLRSLRFRLIASVVAIEVIMLSLLVWNNISIIQSTHTDRLRDTANSMVQQIADTLGNYMIAVDYANMQDYLRKIIDYKELAYIIVVDRDGNTVTALGDISPKARPLAETHPAEVTDGVFDVVRDIRIAGQNLGKLYAGFSLSVMEDTIQRSRSRGITIAAIEIVLTALVTILIGLGFTRRLSTLSNAAAQVESGDYNITLPTDKHDEIAQTAAAFNRMVTEVGNRTRQLEQEEQRSRELLNENRQLIHASLAVQEEERKHLARELHDELGQCLSAIQADAELIRDLSRDNNPQIATSAQAIMEVSSHVYDVVHSMMHRLRPGILDDLGLVEALRDEIDTWKNRHPETVCQFHYSGDLQNLGEQINISLYRIVQECLTNISKHADATRVEINLQRHGDSIQLSIQDNGNGIRADKSPMNRLGLIGMRERADSLGGFIDIESSHNQGTTISFQFPLSNKHDASQ